MKDLYHAFLRKVAHLQIKHPYLTLLVIFSFTIVMIGGAANVRTVASLEQMMPKDIEEISAFHALRDNGLGQDMVAIVVQLNRDASPGILDITDERVHEYIRETEERVREMQDIIEVYSYADLDSLDDASREKAIKNFVNDDKTLTFILATTDVSADDPRMNLLAQRLKDIVSEHPPPTGLEVKLTGTPIIQQKLGEMIARDRKNTQWISSLFVFIITMLTFGTITSAIVPIIIVTISVNWLYGTMGFTNLPISTLAGGVAAMVIGIGIDFAIHIMNKFKYERKKGINIPDAIESAIVDTGTALTATSITTISAFLAFLVGRMPEMGRFGILMSIGIVYSLFFSIFGLPALLVLEEKLIYIIRQKMKFGVEGEFKLKAKEETCEVTGND